MDPKKKNPNVQNLDQEENEQDEEYIDLLVDALLIQNELDVDREETDEDRILQSFGY